MKINEIIPLYEMSMAMGNLDSSLSRVANLSKDEWETGDYIADIEKFKVLKKENVYSLWDNDSLVSFILILPSEIPGAVTVDYWVDKNYRGKKITSQMLFFLKTRMGYSKIIIGKHHSTDTVNMLRNGGLSHFNKGWINIKTGEQIPYDRSQDTAINGSYEPFRNRLSPTDWRIILENTGNFSDYPMFNKDTNLIDIRMMYSGFTDD